MAKVKNFIEEWWYVILMVVFIIGFILVIILEATAPKLTEGLVMNKIASPGYHHCVENGKCVYESPKWIVMVQDGEDKDWWYVTENYYDSVHVGDWVKK